LCGQGEGKDEKSEGNVSDYLQGWPRYAGFFFTTWDQGYRKQSYNLGIFFGLGTGKEYYLGTGRSGQDRALDRIGLAGFKKLG
jgi:hypothetical protein